MCMCVLKVVNPMVRIVCAESPWPYCLAHSDDLHSHPIHLPHYPTPRSFVPALSTHTNPHPNLRDIWYVWGEAEEGGGGYRMGDLLGKRKEEEKGKEDECLGRYTHPP